jgi:hypothetical protein
MRVLQSNHCHSQPRAVAPGKAAGRAGTSCFAARAGEVRLLAHSTTQRKMQVWVVRECGLTLPSRGPVPASRAWPLMSNVRRQRCRDSGSRSRSCWFSTSALRNRSRFRRRRLRQPPSYASIALVSSGPPYGPATQSVRGRFNRLVVVQKGLAYDHPVLRIETLTYGDEGCCTRLASVREIDLNEAAQSGLRLPEAATSQISSTTWESADAATFKYGTYSCRLQGLSKPRVKASCAP